VRCTAPSKAGSLAEGQYGILLGLSSEGKSDIARQTCSTSASSRAWRPVLDYRRIMDRRLVHARLADEFWAASAANRYEEARRIDVDKSIAALRRSIRRIARTHLHASIVAFDEALQFLIHLEATLLDYTHGPKAFALTALVARMKCLAVSFRELILIGQADAARLIVRAFLETSELATVAMADAEFAIAYS